MAVIWGMHIGRDCALAMWSSEAVSCFPILKFQIL